MQLPLLRQDLGLFVASPDHDGTPAWNIHDPVMNRFYRISWVVFEVLSRWHLGHSAAIVAALNEETTLDLEEADIEDVIQFLSQHCLLQSASAQQSEHLQSIRQKQKLHWSKWLLKNYLFFRIPLVRPDQLLQIVAPKFAFVFQTWFWGVIAIVFLLMSMQVYRQWEDFSHSFVAYRNWEALLAFALALSFSKMLHELGHAIAARYYGCRIPSMGVAFLVLWPMLYTDTTESWKLASQRARLQIGAAGMIAELLLALLATGLWFLLPDGPLRAAVFFLATSTWVITLVINASPFMRFDGYFLLSDLLGIPNLHQRAFALGRWWLRERLFGLNLPSPETFPPRLQSFLIVFAYITWLYRFVIFLSIALLVYYFFFKALGIFLMLIELSWFILRPLYDELIVWYSLKQQLHWNKAARRSVLLLLSIIAWIVIPWQSSITVPAVISPQREQLVYVHTDAQITYLTPKEHVQAGEILLRLYAPELELKVQQASIEANNLRWQLEQQSFSPQLLAQGDALREHSAAAEAQLQGLLAEQERLVVRAPFSGQLQIDRDAYQQGSWLSNKMPILTLFDPTQSKIEAWVSEDQLDRVHVNSKGRFISDISEYGRYSCIIQQIDTVNTFQLDEPALTTLYGGNLPAHWDRRASQPILQPAQTHYRVLLEDCAPQIAAPLRIRGQITLEADAQSWLQIWWRYALRWFAKEGGL